MINRLINNLRKFFGISRTEANGLVILILIMIIVIFSPLIYRKYGNGGYDNYLKDSLLMDSIRRLYASEDVFIPDINKNQGQENQRHLFHFDPNTVEFGELISLGIDSIIARRMIKYRNSGGIFKTRKDLLKIYDFPEQLYGELEQYINLPDEKRAFETDAGLPINTSDPEPVDANVARMIVEPFDINKADTTRLKKIYGIGNVLSGRIIKYRELLGGFIDPAQMDEIYGLKGEAILNLKNAIYIDSLFVPVRIRINFAEWEDLVRHPYINSGMATEMVRIRSQNGPYKIPKDLKKVSSMNDSIFHKLIPYLEF